jgi:hypothetical protein
MICHKHKCIFIHIQGCGGSNIERAIQGRDQYEIDLTTKHIPWYTSKSLYSEYWNDYFKFGIVRNPWARIISLSRFSPVTGVVVTKDKLHIQRYLNRYGNKNICEYHGGISMPFGKNSKDLINNSVYLNILGEELDYICKLETIQSDWEFIQEKLKLSASLQKTCERPSDAVYHTRRYTEWYNDKTRDIIYNKYKTDIEHFQYSFEDAL